MRIFFILQKGCSFHESLVLFDSGMAGKSRVMTSKSCAMTGKFRTMTGTMPVDR
ncbi:hypothetical protein M3N64_10030 [Sporolactobacillus sp. CPB3-1]|uniref:Uncharacterized protein n=1 Tax=Sporolactobacillus mangiferae TaxID=2940498 RepID=A0ABT0MD91_9BACL|nr:hypothetical protein [Sporolactobacillus mangiferae]MCL1632275.1 hypothetical protein [Sporolactobacillus mangiferae]